MWKLSKIDIRNFKFFKDLFQLDVNGLNLLLYGENGAGKSSIFWSLYTHFQACTKSNDQAQKYFKHGNKENLRNRYCDATEESYIEIEFSDDNGVSHIIRDSATDFYPANTSICEFMQLSMSSSDFLNYKSLSDMFNFKNSEDNEVFRLFYKDLMPFIDLEEPYKIPEKTDKPNSTGINNFNNSQAWWRHIEEIKENLPLNAKGKPDVHSDEYKNYIMLIDRFNKLMEKELSTITMRANELLRTQFDAKNIKLKCVYQKAYYNEIVSSRRRDPKLYPPKIFMHGEMVGDKVKVLEEIKHPRSFFNEAKLTCMALAFRIAILSQRPSLPGAASIIVIDDMLISLDMVLRRKVISLLLGTFSDRQMMVFTHDRTFFHLFDREIRRRNLKNWTKKELYAEDSNNIPYPRLIESNSYIDQARMHLSNFHLAACANTLRRGFESEMKRLLPYNMQVQVNHENPEKAQIDFNGLIIGFNNMVREGYLPDIAPSLDTDRMLIMNPFSHDDIETPIYRNELHDLIEDLEKLNNVVRGSLTEPSDINDTEFDLEVSNSEYSAGVKFTYREMYYVYSYNGNQYYTNPKIRIKEFNCPNAAKKKLKKNLGINQVYSILYNSISLNAQTAPQLYSCVSRTSDSKKYVSGKHSMANKGKDN